MNFFGKFWLQNHEPFENREENDGDDAIEFGLCNVIGQTDKYIIKTIIK